MAIDRAEAARIAELARLEIEEADLDALPIQLSQGPGFAPRLVELVLKGPAPLALPPPEAPLREDTPDGRTLEPGTATADAPEAEYGYFIVPPVVENLEP